MNVRTDRQTDRPHELHVYVGLAQARPNYVYTNYTVHNVIYYHLVCILESFVSFESANYVAEEEDGHVELTIALTKEVLINNTSIGLRTMDGTTNGEFL